MPQTIAALDMGSNTFRLMLAKPSGAGWADKKVFQHIPRLSENLTEHGCFSPKALVRCWRTLDEFDGLIKAAGAKKVFAAATMAARLAADGEDFMAAIRVRYNWNVDIISGLEEARLTALGVLSELKPLPEQALIFDIGGRSTEFISTEKRSLIQSRSLPLGVVALTEKYFVTDPPVATEFKAMKMAVRDVLQNTDFSDVKPGAVLVGTAGTVTTLAAMLLKLETYRPELINNARINKDDLLALLTETSRETVTQRVSRHGLHPRRADVVVAGLILVMEILDFFKLKELIVSDNSLLEGLWLKTADLLEQ